MVGPVGGFADGQGPFEAGAGLRQLTQAQLDDAQIDESMGEVAMVGAIDLEDCQGTLQVGAGVLKLPQVSLDDAQIPERLGDLEMVGAIRSLEDGQGTFDDGTGFP